LPNFGEDNFTFAKDAEDGFAVAKQSGNCKLPNVPGRIANSTQRWGYYNL
jgi:hypothetical protein